MVFFVASAKNVVHVNSVALSRFFREIIIIAFRFWLNFSINVGWKKMDRRMNRQDPTRKLMNENYGIASVRTRKPVNFLTGGKNKIKLEIRISQIFPRPGIQRDYPEGEKDILLWQ